MTRVLRQYSKSQLEKVVEVAVTARLVAEARVQRLLYRTWRERVALVLAGVIVGLAAGAFLL